MTTNKSPRSAKLRPLYAHARLLVDQLGVLTWKHHYRANNKMADHLANAAMNSCNSAQDTMPSDNKQLDGVREFLATDMGQWLTDPARG